MQNSIVVIAEHADGQIRPVTYELLAFAKKTPAGHPINSNTSDLIS